jgi:hypothetical protein
MVIPDFTIVHKRYTDKVWNITFKNSSGVPIDITGATVYVTVKHNSASSDDSAVIKKKITSHSDPTNGATQLTITKDDSNISEKDYILDIKFYLSGSLSSSSYSGIFRVPKTAQTSLY